MKFYIAVNIKVLKGITKVIADNNSDTVKITCTKINLEKANDLRYNYIG